MNLYKITIGHAAPKDWCISMLGFVLAENDEQVYEYIKSEPEINGHHPYNSWADNEEENKKFKKKIIRLKGEINDGDYDFSDSYYGISLYGWELIKENVSGLDAAIEIGIVSKINNQ